MYKYKTLSVVKSERTDERYWDLGNHYISHKTGKSHLPVEFRNEELVFVGTYPVSDKDNRAIHKALVALDR